jgi:O-acetyl-ADP-ribose deacetylase (regulator of RNase III)
VNRRCRSHVLFVALVCETLMELHLADQNVRLVDAWKVAFHGLSGVTIHFGNILAIAENSIVSPANSHGHMDGGIDREYLDFFGHQLQRRVYDIVAGRPEGLIPVGSAAIVETKHSRIQYLIVAPTMETPEEVGPENCYRALRAVLRAAARDRDHIHAIYCPGLATGIGHVEEEAAAGSMAAAYRDWLASGAHAGA